METDRKPTETDRKPSDTELPPQSGIIVFPVRFLLPPWCHDRMLTLNPPGNARNDLADLDRILPRRFALFRLAQRPVP